MKRLTTLVFATLVVGALVTVGAAEASALPAGTRGADVSWPQCSGSLFSSVPPTGSASFAILGVNNGKPGAANPCLANQFTWAGGLGAQAPQIYVNTADPGNTVASWPTGGMSPGNPYGPCTQVKSRGKMAGANNQACAYEYGAQQATNDLNFASAAGVSSARWWLDVETANSWQSRNLTNMNQAVLLGMVNVFQSASITVGAYSTNYQWNKILGTLDGSTVGTLSNLPQWIPTGGNNETIAAADCTNATALPSFTQGPRTYVQYTSTYDYDIACGP